MLAEAIVWFEVDRLSDHLGFLPLAFMTVFKPVAEQISRSERAFWLAWSQIDGVGAILIKRLQQHFSTLRLAWEAESAELEAVDGIGWQTAKTIAAARAFDPFQFLEDHEQQNPCFWTPADAEYPCLLLEIPDSPPVLYYRGEADMQENWGNSLTVAIVGTRSPSEYGRRWTRKLSRAMAQAGITVVSGLAEGIDTEAHRSCLEADGRTIAVLGTGVNVVYPWSNRQLASQIVQQGLLISEHPAGTKPERIHFPRRNRIIAGLCRAVLVLEAPHKSGALITARLANEYSRDVYALPGSLDNDRSIGCLELLNQGAHPILGEDYLLEMLGTMPQFQTATPAVEPQQLSLLSTGVAVTQLEPELQAVLQATSFEATALDWIVDQSGLATAVVLSALSQLELMGLVSLQPGMRYQKEK